MLKVEPLSCTLRVPVRCMLAPRFSVLLAVDIHGPGDIPRRRRRSCLRALRLRFDTASLAPKLRELPLKTNAFAAVNEPPTPSVRVPTPLLSPMKREPLMVSALSRVSIPLPPLLPSPRYKLLADSGHRNGHHHRPGGPGRGITADVNVV